jgi:hypothetical protein
VPALRAFGAGGETSPEARRADTFIEQGCRRNERSVGPTRDVFSGAQAP